MVCDGAVEVPDAIFTLPPRPAFGDAAAVVPWQGSPYGLYGKFFTHPPYPPRTEVRPRIHLPRVRCGACPRRRLQMADDPGQVPARCFRWPRVTESSVTTRIRWSGRLAPVTPREDSVIRRRG